MVPIAADHAAYVVDGNLFPFLISDVLPAWNFLEHEQADLVASIEKVARLRIVGRTHDVAMEVLAQDVGVLSLNASGHGLTCKRKCLVTVQSA